jgi:hypothetical protein
MAPTANISRRHEITWSSAPTSEPTSTLVLTSAAGKFVDIRIFKDPQDPNCTTPGSQLEWAIAGQTTYTTTPTGERRGRWAHWIDSRSTRPAADEGVLERVPDADVRARWPELVPDADDSGELPEVTRETGCMVNAATGREEEYEEIWVDERKEVPGRAAGAEGEFGREEGSCCVVARFEGHGEVLGRGLIVWIAQFCQGILRVGEEVTVERWEFRGEWVSVYREGNGCLPCGWVVKESSDLREGNEFTAPLTGGMKWKIVESDF